MRKLLLTMLFLVSLSVWIGPWGRAQATKPAQETPLKPSGFAYEINPDANGILWISDWSDGVAGEIWGINPLDGSYTIYSVGGGPSDARSDGAGSLWWADAESNQVGRLGVNNGNATIWEIPGSNGLFGTALDGAGGLWIADTSVPKPVPSLYHLSAANELCTYTLPAHGAADYVVRSGSQLWLGDYNNNRILRLDTAANPNTFTRWQLVDGSYPEGMALDSNGNLWWADLTLGGLGKLQPGTNQVVRYTQAQVTSPAMVSLKNGRVWFSSQAVFGVLDPAQSQGITTTVTTASQPVTPTCNPLPPTSTPTFTLTPGQTNWTNVNYQELYDQSGWQIYALPPGGSSWGIATLGEIFIVDQGRQVLARLSDLVGVKACKLQDADGNPATTADQTPVADWTVYLRIDGAPQTPSKLTGADGCATWSDLQPGPAYGVDEDVVTGWVALTPTSHDFGPASAGQSYAYTFINTQMHSIYLPLVSKP